MDTYATNSHSEGESFEGLHERVLTFMGRFSSMQFAMDSALEIYLGQRLPILGPVLSKQFLDRIRDDQRLPCFLAFAKDSGYARDLTSIKFIYLRAKATRDLMGHSQGIVGPVRSPRNGPARHQVAVTTLRRTSRRLVPDPLQPSTFDRLGNDCAWLQEHADRALYEASVITWIDSTGQPYEPPVPDDLPRSGEPLT